MLRIQYPPANFRIRQQNDVDEIFDPVRKRWVLLTPEEWVRQNFIAFLRENCSIPFSMIGVEKKLKVGELSRRFDIVVFANTGQPWLLVECKAMDISLGPKTISQVLSYVSSLACPYFIISNGSHTYGWQIGGGKVFPIEVFPPYS